MQKGLLPVLHNIGAINFDNSFYPLWVTCFNRKDSLPDFKIINNGRPTFISCEGVSSKNPSQWESNALTLRQWIPENIDTTIVIGIRNTKDWVHSIYMQMLHEGQYFLKPNQFALPSEVFASVKEKLGTKLAYSRHLDIDAFDLHLLYKIYERLFGNVKIIIHDEISFATFESLGVNTLNADKHTDVLNKAIQQGKLGINKSFSNRSFEICMSLDNLLKRLGVIETDPLRTIITSEDEVYAKFGINKKPEHRTEREYSKSTIDDFFQKINLNLRGEEGLCQLITNRRHILQNILDKQSNIPYEKFTSSDFYLGLHENANNNLVRKHSLTNKVSK